MKSTRFSTTEKEITSAIAVANDAPASPEGWEKVVWANKLSVSARKVSYGFNYQPKGKFTVGGIVSDAWGGIKDQAIGSVCKVIAIA